MIDDKKSSEGSQNSIFFLGHALNKYHHSHCKILSKIFMQQSQRMLNMILYSINRYLKFLRNLLVFPIFKPAHIKYPTTLIRQSIYGIHYFILQLFLQQFTKRVVIIFHILQNRKIS